MKINLSTFSGHINLQSLSLLTHLIITDKLNLSVDSVSALLYKISFQLQSIAFLELFVKAFVKFLCLLLTQLCYS